jgi:hypothetical protein
MSRPAIPAVTLHVWRVPAHRVPAAVVASRRTVHRLRRRGDVSFAKVLGTATAEFLPHALTPRRWAALTCWRSDPGDSPPADVETWFDQHCDERASLSLRPVWTRGSWDGRAPFGPDGEDSGTERSGPVVVLTRSTLRLSRAHRFYRAVPAVAAELRDAAGCRVAFGIGEAPVRRQGTVSIWTSTADMRRFAYHCPNHRAAVDATPGQRWYAEELFARFAVVEAAGSIDGVML